MRRIVVGVCLFAVPAYADWTPPELRHVPSLRTIPLHGDDGLGSSTASLGVIVAEEWGTNPLISTNGGTGIEIVGSNRAFLADTQRGASDITTWEEISFRKLALLGQELSFTVDFSQVECGCNGAIYLVEMPEVPPDILSSGYCDIQGNEPGSAVPPCAELDLIEGYPPDWPLGDDDDDGDNTALVIFASVASISIGLLVALGVLLYGGRGGPPTVELASAVADAEATPHAEQKRGTKHARTPRSGYGRVSSREATDDVYESGAPPSGPAAEELRAWLLASAKVPSSRVDALMAALAAQWVEDRQALQNSLGVLEEHLPAAAYSAIKKAVRADENERRARGEEQGRRRPN